MFFAISSLTRHTAHDIVGTLVGKLSRAGKNFVTDFDTCAAHLREHGIQATDKEIREILSPKHVMLSYNSLGGTGAHSVRAMMDKMRVDLQHKRAAIEADRLRVQTVRAMRKGCRLFALPTDPPPPPQCQAYDNCRSMASAAASVKDVKELRALVKKHMP